MSSRRKFHELLKNNLRKGRDGHSSTKKMMEDMKSDGKMIKESTNSDKKTKFEPQEMKTAELMKDKKMTGEPRCDKMKNIAELMKDKKMTGEPRSYKMKTAESTKGETKTGDPRSDDMKTAELMKDNKMTGEPKSGEMKTAESTKGETKTGEPRSDDMKTAELMKDKKMTGEPRSDEMKTVELMKDNKMTGEPRSDEMKTAESTKGEMKTGEPRSDEMKTAKLMKDNKMTCEPRSDEMNTAELMKDNKMTGEPRSDGMKTVESTKGETKTGDPRSDDMKTAELMKDNKMTGGPRSDEMNTAELMKDNKMTGEPRSDGMKTVESTKGETKTGDPRSDDMKTAELMKDNKMTGEPKSGEMKTAESTKGETKTGEPKSDDMKTAELMKDKKMTGEPRSDEMKTVELMKDNKMTGEPRSDEIKTAESTKGEMKTGEPRSDEMKTAELMKDNKMTGEPKSDGMKTAESTKGETKTGEPRSDGMKTAESTKDETKTGEPRSDGMKTAESKKDETKTGEPKSDGMKTVELMKAKKNTGRPRSDETDEIKTGELLKDKRRTGEPRSDEMKTAELMKDKKKTTGEPRSDEMKTAELMKDKKRKTGEPMSDEMKTAELMKDKRKTGEPRSDEMKTAELMKDKKRKTGEPMSDEMKTAELMKDKRKTGEPRSDEMKTAELMKDKKMTGEPRSDEMKTFELTKDKRKTLPGTKAATPTSSKLCQLLKSANSEDVWTSLPYETDSSYSSTVLELGISGLGNVVSAITQSIFVNECDTTKPTLTENSKLKTVLPPLEVNTYLGDLDPDHDLEEMRFPVLQNVPPYEYQEYEDQDYQYQHCEHGDCKEGVFAACVKQDCLCFLCYEHFINDESCENHGVAKKQKKKSGATKKFTKKDNIKKAEEKDKGSDEKDKHNIREEEEEDTSNNHCEYKECFNDVVSSCFVCGTLLCFNHLNSDSCKNHEHNLKNVKKPRKIKRKARNKYVPNDPTEDVKSPQHCEFKNCLNDVISTCFGCSCLLCIDHLDSDNCTDHEKFVTGESSDESEGEDDTTKRGRKKRRRKETWKNEKRKMSRNRGDSYVCSNKKRRIAREMREPCEDCKYFCAEKVSHTRRQAIFDEFWDLGELNKQRIYIRSRIDQIQPAYRYCKSTQKKQIRKYNNAYHFFVNGKKVRVCKVFFESTLDINAKVIATAMEKIKDGVLVEDKRGKHGKHQRVDSKLKESVRSHINSIPRIESHYLRSQTTREYIDGGLTMMELYRLYVKQQKENDKEYVKYHMYYEIFNTEFNISFFTPKKDQCDLCESYNNASNEDKKKYEKKYEKHLEEKKMSRIEKEKDKNKSDKNYIVAAYDLQAVLPCPRGDNAAFFYKSRLSTYNLTVSEFGSSRDVHCYLWDETRGNRGANEIGSCVLKFLDQKASQATESTDIVLYSDNCCGQQKNKYLVSLYLYVVNTYPNVASITHKFLIKGHTQNEGDVAHSVIERSVNRALKSGPIYVPSQYATIIQLAKKTGKPYNVFELSHHSFLDLKDLAHQLDVSDIVLGGEEKFADIKIMRFDKKQPSCMQIKTTYDPKEDYRTIDLTIPKVQTRKSGANQKKKINFKNVKLKTLYDTKIDISDRKKKDLLKLVEDDHIKDPYKEFYLPICKK